MERTKPTQAAKRRLKPKTNERVNERVNERAADHTKTQFHCEFKVLFLCALWAACEWLLYAYTYMDIDVHLNAVMQNCIY